MPVPVASLLRSSTGAANPHLSVPANDSVRGMMTRLSGPADGAGNPGNRIVWSELDSEGFMKARDIMTPRPLAVIPTDPVWKAAEIMKYEDIGGVPVVSDKRIKAASKRAIATVDAAID